MESSFNRWVLVFASQILIFIATSVNTIPGIYFIIVAVHLLSIIYFFMIKMKDQDILIWIVAILIIALNCALLFLDMIFTFSGPPRFGSGLFYFDKLIF